jgi:hypothetical protein
VWLLHSRLLRTFCIEWLGNKALGVNLNKLSVYDLYGEKFDLSV